MKKKIIFVLWCFFRRAGCKGWQEYIRLNTELRQTVIE